MTRQSPTVNVGLKQGYTYRQGNAKDPGLDEFISDLEGANIPILGKNLEIIDDITHQIVGEIDVLTPNAALQYKDGVSGAKKIIQQVTENTEPFLNMPVITFVKGSAETAKATTRTVQRAGPYVLVTNNINLLVNTIR